MRSLSRLFMHLIFQTVSGIAVGETRDDSKEFEYDHSYWSVDTSGDHFVSQEQVHNGTL